MYCQGVWGSTQPRDPERGRVCLKLVAGGLQSWDVNQGTRTGLLAYLILQLGRWNPSTCPGAPVHPEDPHPALSLLPHTPETHLGQMLLRSKAKAIDSVGATVCPLPELLGGFGKGHVGSDSAVDNGLGRGEQSSRLMGLLIMNVRPRNTTCASEVLV